MEIRCVAGPSVDFMDRISQPLHKSSVRYWLFHPSGAMEPFFHLILTRMLTDRWYLVRCFAMIYVPTYVLTESRTEFGCHFQIFYRRKDRRSLSRLCTPSPRESACPVRPALQPTVPPSPYPSWAQTKHTSPPSLTYPDTLRSPSQNARHAP